jgi:hypothetical protein
VVKREASARGAKRVENKKTTVEKVAIVGVSFLKAIGIFIWGVLYL